MCSRQSDSYFFCIFCEPGDNTNAAAANSDQANNKEPSAKNDEINKQNCEAAKKNLDIFKVHKRVKMDDGKIVYLDGEEKQKRIEEAEAQIRLFCK